MSDNRDRDSLSMIVVMGVTGSGKSYFINKLAGIDVVKTGDDLHSCTAKCQAVPVNIGGSKVLLLDTPGFDDSKLSDSEILTEISRILAAQYEVGVSLKGVIYLHRIIDVRYSGASVKTLDIFKKICGNLALKNVVLVSTRWHEVEDTVGALREQQLRDDIWAYMLGHGSTMARFYGNRDSAIGIISQLVSRQSIVLELQRELIKEGKTLKQTVAGAFVHDELSDKKAQLEQDLKGLEQLKQTLQDNARVMKRKAQQDWDREHQRLMTAREDEARLQRDIATEVREEIEEKKTKKRARWKKALPIIPSLLGILGMFVGIPPGSTALLTSWFSDSGVGESVSDFFSSF